MILDIRVIPKATRSLVKEEANLLKVYLTKPAQDNLANAQLIDLSAFAGDHPAFGGVDECEEEAASGDVTKCLPVLTAVRQAAGRGKL